MTDQHLSSSTRPRRRVEPETVKEEISLNLQLVRSGNALKQGAVRDAFKVVASLVVDDMVRRGYEVTAPPPNDPCGRPDGPPMPRLPRGR